MDLTIPPLNPVGMWGTQGGSGVNDAGVPDTQPPSVTGSGTVPDTSLPTTGSSSNGSGNDGTYIVDMGLYSGTLQYYSEVVDQRTHEPIRLSPPEELLRLFAAIQQELGQRVDQKS
jgi:hypothetical protein